MTEMRTTTTTRSGTRSAKRAVGDAKRRRRAAGAAAAAAALALAVAAAAPSLPSSAEAFAAPPVVVGGGAKGAFGRGAVSAGGPLFVSTSPASTGEASSSSSGKGFAKTERTEAAESPEVPPMPPAPAVIPPEHASLPTLTLKSRLLTLLPRMTGRPDEFREVENLVNALEDKYEPITTLGFLNMAVGGTWQLLFSTNRLGVPSPGLRLRELKQEIATDGLKGTLTNMARWDLAEEVGGEFDRSGTFDVKCAYEINQGARMLVSLEEHILKPSRGSPLPTNPQKLVGDLYRAMPTEMFDPDGCAMDVTYMDAEVRIVRLTGGGRYEGFRNIFVREGAVTVDPRGEGEEEEEEYDPMG